MNTTDLIDKHEDLFTLVNISAYLRFGTIKKFHGKIVTVKCFEDNTKAKALLETNGRGKVLVVDGGGSHGRALMGDNVAAIAIKNGWEGVVFHGCIRDAAQINSMPIGVVALAATPRRSKKENTGDTNISLHFAEADFEPDHFIYVDEDGMLLSEKLLTI